MNKLDIKKIKRSGYTVFNTKKEMLDYLNKTSFQMLNSYRHYRAIVCYCRRKWLVKWEED